MYDEIDRLGGRFADFSFPLLPPGRLNVFSVTREEDKKRPSRLKENPDILLQVMYDQAAEEAELLARLERNSPVSEGDLTR
jgi:hypothetical protein